MKAKNGISKVFVWILLGLLIIGIAGFGTVNFSGSVQSVATVGDKSVTVNDYARALQSEICAIEAQTGQPVPFQDARAMGVDQAALSQLITARALDHEAAQLGLSVGDEELLNQIQTIAAFQGPDGSFDRDAYRYALQNVNLSEAEFEQQLRDESARTLLQSAVLAGTSLPDSYIDTLIAFTQERRSFTWTTIENGDLMTGVPVPSEEDLASFHQDNIDRYTRPEQRRITYAWLSPDMILDTVEIEDSVLRQSYAERSAEFNQPERRLVERLVYPDDPAAQAALDRITSGETSFEDEVAARGLDLADTDIGDVTVEDLGAAGEAVFAANVGDVTGPLASDFGPALYRVNGKLAAESMPFIAAKEILREGLVLDRARRDIEAQIEPLQDLLAGGATLEELAGETDLVLGTIDWDPTQSDGIAAYDAFRDAALDVTADDFPEMLDLGDGGLFALRLDAVIPPAPLALEDVRDLVDSDWTADAVENAAFDQAESYANQINEGRVMTSLNLRGSQSETDVSRRGYIEALPPGAIDAVFDLEPGQARALRDTSRAILIQLDGITPADANSDEAKALATVLRDQAANDVAQDLFRAMAADIQARAGISIDQQALNAVHSNFQ